MIILCILYTRCDVSINPPHLKADIFPRRGFWFSSYTESNLKRPTQGSFKLDKIALILVGKFQCINEKRVFPTGALPEIKLN